MKIFAFLMTFLSSISAFAGVSCEQLQKEEVEVKVLRTKEKVVTAANWKNFDVLAGFDRSRCLDSLSQQLIEVNGEKYWRFETADDSCDGGNTYGAIYSYDLKTPVAHIYDTDITCQKDWRADYQATFHRCDLGAEAYALDKMKAFGLEFQVLNSSLELRKNQPYSAISVTGKLPNKGHREASVKVIVRLNNCSYSTAIIQSIIL